MLLEEGTGFKEKYYEIREWFIFNVRFEEYLNYRLFAVTRGILKLWIVIKRHCID